VAVHPRHVWREQPANLWRRLEQILVKALGHVQEVGLDAIEAGPKAFESVVVHDGFRKINKGLPSTGTGLICHATISKRAANCPIPA
jgi:hypothetical protein